MRLPRLFLAVLLVVAPVSMLAAADSALRTLVASRVAADYQSLDALYKTLHANPELSLMEIKTSARMGAEFRAAGFEVTEKVGGSVSSA